MKASDYILYLIMLVSIKSFLAWVRTFTDEGKFPVRSLEKTGLSNLALFIIY